MVFTDDKGERREIYMPARDFYKAMAHVIKEEWDELVKFPKWENQSHTDADNLKNITDIKAFYSVPPPEDDDDDDDDDAKIHPKRTMSARRNKYTSHREGNSKPCATQVNAHGESPRHSWSCHEAPYPFNNGNERIEATNIACMVVMLSFDEGRY
ncbi:hypothetical protein NHJ6243_002998 [Beauveria neobassiana]